MSETYCFPKLKAGMAGGNPSASKDRHVCRPGFDPRGLQLFLANRYPHKTALNVAADAGVSARTAERWLSAQPIAPGLSNFLVLVGRHGLPLLAASFVERPAWLVDGARLSAEMDAFAKRNGLERRGR